MPLKESIRHLERRFVPKNRRRCRQKFELRTPAREYEVRIFDDTVVDFSERSGVPGVLLILSGAYELTWPGGQTVVA
ncbi:hypothetical protein, partial [Pyramidobacter sp. C12-8]|uniref:hypothetical protein n=1 Tax=Pyramidobacter sp. C12-8 TaxID=1943580 RepID=UPI00197FD4CC